MKATPRHLLIMLSTLLLTWGLCETGMRYFSIAPSPTDRELLEDFQISRLEEAPEGAILLLGDSSLGNAVDEEILENELGVPCRNLALVGTLGLHGDELLLKKIIRSEKKAKAIVIMHAASVWNQNAKAAGNESLEHKIGTPSLKRTSKGLFSKLPSSENSRTMKSLLFLRGQGLKPHTRTFENRQKRIAEVTESLPRLSYVPQGPRLQLPDSANAPAKSFIPNPEVEKQLTRILETARKAGLPVILSVGPHYAGDSLSSHEFSTGLDAWLQNLAKPFDQTRIACGQVPPVPGKFIGDTRSHVTREARPHFSKWIAGLLLHELDPAEVQVANKVDFNDLWPDSAMQALTEIPE